MNRSAGLATRPSISFDRSSDVPRVGLPIPCTNGSQLNCPLGPGRSRTLPASRCGASGSSRAGTRTLRPTDFWRSNVCQMPESLKMRTERRNRETPRERFMALRLKSGTRIPMLVSPETGLILRIPLSSPEQSQGSGAACAQMVIRPFGAATPRPCRSANWSWSWAGIRRPAGGTLNGSQ